MYMIIIASKYVDRLRLIICVFVLTFFINIDKVHAQHTTKVYADNLKTLRIYVDGNELSYPVIEMNGENSICFEFDLLGSDAKSYSYQIMHCNENWERSDLFSDDFMEGFNENLIYDYSYSANTKVDYIHYKVQIPNDDVELKLSGNYIIRIIEDGDRDITIATARFMLYEPIVNVQAVVQKAMSSDYAGSGQEIRFSVFHEDYEIVDPFSEVKVRILQNNREDRIISGIKPVFVRNNELVYGFSGENILPGGNEFRMFSSKNLKQYGENVNDIQFVDSMYYYQLKIDERRSYKRYFWQEDLNGSYLVFLDNSFDYHVSADYTYVYFYLPMEKPMLEGKVFVYGELTNWSLDSKSEMVYNFEKQMYEGKMVLKQGIYDYAYVYKDNYSGVIDEPLIEGSHYETENDYLIFIYHKNMQDDYDRLIGYQVVNSR